MPLPDFIKSMPELDLPFPTDMVTTSAIRSDQGLAVFFTVHQDISIPEHSHKAQWGTVIKGSVTLTRNGETKTYLPGESYSIRSGEPHAADVAAGSVVMDIFEEPDRYPLRG